MCVHLTTGFQRIRQETRALKGEMDKSTITVGDLNTPLSVTDGKNEQKITDSLEDLINTNTKLDLIDTDRKLHLATAKYAFFLNDRERSSSYNIIWTVEHTSTNVKESKL